MTEQQEYVDDDHQRIAEFAEDFLDEDERDDFVDTLMERRGYQRVSNWGPKSAVPRGDGKDQDGSRSRSRSSGGQGQQQRSRRPAYFKR